MNGLLSQRYFAMRGHHLQRFKACRYRESVTACRSQRVGHGLPHQRADLRFQRAGQRDAVDDALRTVLPACSPAAAPSPPVGPVLECLLASLSFLISPSFKWVQGKPRRHCRRNWFFHCGPGRRAGLDLARSAQRPCIKMVDAETR